MKIYKLMWLGMNGITYEVKAESLKEARVRVLEAIDEIQIALSDIKLVGTSPIKEISK